MLCYSNMESYDELKNMLDKLQACDFDAINFFDAVGMTTQEVKHSRFLVWLLKQDAPHNLKDSVLKKLCRELWGYKTKGDDKNSNSKANRDILAGVGITSEMDFEVLMSGPVSVDPEVHILLQNAQSSTKDENRYIDILIKSNNAVIVIENKVNSDVHTNQLQSYEDYINNQYPNLKKIFVFMSPHGMLPYNIGGNNQYNSNWCMIDYSSFLKIINELLKDVKEGGFTYETSKQQNKLVILLEDYRDMVNKVILKDEEKWKLVSKYSSNIEELYQCIQNKRKNLEYCHTWLKNNIVGYIDAEDAVNEGSFTFHTKAIVDYLKRYSEQYETKKCTWYCGTNGCLDGLLDLYVVGDKKQKKTWTPAQNIIRAKLGSTAKDHVIKFNTILLTNEEWLKPLFDIQSKLDDGHGGGTLLNFKKVIDEFDNAISTL